MARNDKLNLAADFIEKEHDSCIRIINSNPELFASNPSIITPFPIAGPLPGISQSTQSGSDITSSIVLGTLTLPNGLIFDQCYRSVIFKSSPAIEYNKVFGKLPEAYNSYAHGEGSRLSYDSDPIQIGLENWLSFYLISISIESIYQHYAAQFGLVGITKIQIPLMNVDNDTESKVVAVIESVGLNSFENFIPMIPSSLHLRKLIKQLLSNLYLLKDIMKIDHGNLTIASISVDNTPITYRYYTATTTSSPDSESNLDTDVVTLRIGGFEYSSIGIQFQPALLNSNGDDLNSFTARIYPRVPAYDHFRDVPPCKFLFGNVGGIIFYYIPSTFTGLSLRKLRGAGIPMMISWDFYTLLISILANRTLYRLIDSNKELSQILITKLFWEADWLLLYNRLTIYHQREAPITIDEIPEILQNIRLRCDAIDKVIDEFWLADSSSAVGK